MLALAASPRLAYTGRATFWADGEKIKVGVVAPEVIIFLGIARKGDGDMRPSSNVGKKGKRRKKRIWKIKKMKATGRVTRGVNSFLENHPTSSEEKTKREMWKEDGSDVSGSRKGRGLEPIVSMAQEIGKKRDLDSSEQGRQC